MAVGHSVAPFGLRRPGETTPGATPASVPPAVTGANITELDVPDSVVEGGTFTITGTIHYNNISRPLTQTPTRVLAKIPGRTDTIQQLDDLAHCNSRSFALEVQATGSAGETMQVTVESQDAQLDDWGQNETQGPFTVQILSEGAAARQTVTEFAPWVIGGGAVGAAGASFTGRQLLTGAALGAGAGVGVKVLTEQGGVGGVIGLPQIGTLEALSFALLLGGAGYFLSTTTDILPDADAVTGRLPTPSRRSRPPQ